MTTIIALGENLALMLPALLVVAYVTVAERKTMASMQRRLGPVWWQGKSSYIWVKLSNSGDLLKLKVPSYSWKAISGWINYSCTVTSLKICENIMDNRGSKSMMFKTLL